MYNTPTTASPATASLRATQVYSMAFLCVIIGLAIGYLLRSSQLAVQLQRTTAQVASPEGSLAGKPNPHRRPSLEEMREIADKQAAPLLEKLKSNPRDGASLIQVAAIYHTSHRFKEAAVYYSKALENDPKNAALRTKLASSLYRGGDLDGAIAQLNAALADQPNDANALFDLGLIKLQGKSDSKGAIAAWQRLLKTNPQLSSDRRATVLKLMADAMTMMNDQHQIQKTVGR